MLQVSVSSDIFKRVDTSYSIEKNNDFCVSNYLSVGDVNGNIIGNILDSDNCTLESDHKTVILKDS